MSRRSRILASAIMALLLPLAAAVAQQAPPASTPQAPQSKERKEVEKRKEPQAAEAAGAKGHEGAEEASEAGGPSSELAEASREAAGEGEENAQFKHSPSVRWIANVTGLSLKWAYWLAIAFNFAVLAGLIVWFSKSSLPAMFRTRTQGIQKTMLEAQRSSEDAGRRLNQIESRLAKLDVEIGAMRNSADAEAAAEEERIRGTAEEDRRKIVEAAEQEIAAAARVAERELKAYAAELAVSLAEKRIHVDASTDRALVESFVGQLGRPNGGGGEDR